ncbi:hypothetical protein CDAR_79461 [Caerostris darwini]|uniref:Uncharacterized protein n=1 Tax=Caerostris darwini TaxID=1538125 RepID=A0AAV4RLH8_9ARAC|nr:hypothetical protein CDAR_79461 [Caerostris darwini]
MGGYAHGKFFSVSVYLCPNPNPIAFHKRTEGKGERLSTCAKLTANEIQYSIKTSSASRETNKGVNTPWSLKNAPLSIQEGPFVLSESTSPGESESKSLEKKTYLVHVGYAITDPQNVPRMSLWPLKP